jgi:hypothetical protein
MCIFSWISLLLLLKRQQEIRRSDKRGFIEYNQALAPPGQVNDMFTLPTFNKKLRET